jgi:hypothetical protein
MIGTYTQNGIAIEQGNLGQSKGGDVEPFDNKRKDDFS